MALTIKKWLTQAKTLVNPLDAELILTNVFKASDRTFLVSHSEKILSAEERQVADKMLTLRAVKVPLAYITSEKWFYGRKFKVTPDVLIPRPETEQMVETTIGLYNMLATRIVIRYEEAVKARIGVIEPSWPDNPNVKEELEKIKEEILSPVMIFDVGTGSGCAAISVGLECAHAQVLALDISEPALKVARENKTKLKAENVVFALSDLLDRISDSAPVPDIIMANLPYVDRDWEWSSPEIEYEPSIALFAERNGLALIYKLMRQIKQKWPALFEDKKRNHQKFLVLESDISQQERIIRYARRSGFSLVKKQGLITCFEY
jgi:ribosomal protein L11 methyltransferase (prmA)